MEFEKEMYQNNLIETDLDLTGFTISRDGEPILKFSKPTHPKVIMEDLLVFQHRVESRSRPGYTHCVFIFRSAPGVYHSMCSCEYAQHRLNKQVNAGQCHHMKEARTAFTEWSRDNGGL